MRGDLRIDTEHQYLEYRSFNEEDGAVFLLQKKAYMTGFHLAFDLRYYPSYQGFEGSRSGASIFRPATNESLRYGNITNIFIQRSEVVSQITLIYNSPQNETAVVKARMTFDSPLIEWDVNMETVQVTDTGKEVTVNFRSYDIENYDSFYTDQNGLEMQERYLNERVGSWVMMESPYGNISQNFYPVTSAIALRDIGDNEKEQLTVMVPRTMAGSSLKTGKIELLHARRLLFDDQVSREIVLNETLDPPMTTYVV